MWGPEVLLRVIRRHHDKNNLVSFLVGIEMSHIFFDKFQLKPEQSYSSDELNDIRSRLDKYYGAVVDYTAFLKPSAQDHCWRHIGTEIRKRAAGSLQPIRVLEIGAGKSGFGLWLNQQDMRGSVHWVAQDVTAKNSDWLKEQTDDFIIGDINKIDDKKFDLIFSTFVLEHVTEPSTHLEHLFELLQIDGSLFIFCPRYDFPGYLCPSSRHLNILGRLGMLIKQHIHRIHAFVTNKPSFLIQADLAAFHGPFFTDADAVHWVSLFDLKYWANGLGAKFSRLKLGSPSFASKDWIVKRWLTCAVEIRKGL